MKLSMTRAADDTALGGEGYGAVWPPTLEKVGAEKRKRRVVAGALIDSCNES
jgi:hypothetical protein